MSAPEGDIGQQTSTLAFTARGLRFRPVTESAGEEWLSVPQAAKLLGLQLNTLHALIDRGDLAADILPPGKKSTGRRRAIRISREAIGDYLERARVKPGDLRHLHPEWTWERYG